jgi:hypothetical protein
MILMKTNHPYLRVGRHTQLHHQRQGPRLHEQVLVRVVRVGGGQAQPDDSLPPAVGRAIRGGEQGDHHVSALPSGGSDATVATMASLGGVLLQH